MEEENLSALGLNNAEEVKESNTLPEVVCDQELQVNDNQIIGALNSIFPPLPISKGKGLGTRLKLLEKIIVSFCERGYVHKMDEPLASPFNFYTSCFSVNFSQLCS